MDAETIMLGLAFCAVMFFGFAILGTLIEKSINKSITRELEEKCNQTPKFKTKVFGDELDDYISR